MPYLHKSGMNPKYPNIYPKYGKLFIETMTLPASYVMTRLRNDYLI